MLAGAYPVLDCPRIPFQNVVAPTTSYYALFERRCDLLGLMENRINLTFGFCAKN